MTPIQATLHQRAEKCSAALNTIVNYKTRGHFDLQGDEELVKDNKQRGSCLQGSVRTAPGRLAVLLWSPGQWGCSQGKGPIECKAILPWHLIKGIKAWEVEPTGYPPGSALRSYQKQRSSKHFNFPILKEFWPEPLGGVGGAELC